MIRFLFGRSLSVRLLWLTIAVVLAAEVLVFVPSVARARHDWLARHVREGGIAILAVAAAPNAMPDARMREAALRLSDAVSVRLHVPGRETLTLERDAPPVPAAVVDLREETQLQAIGRAVTALVRTGNALLRVSAPSPLDPRATIEIVLGESELDQDLRRYARNVGLVSVVIALAAGTLIYLALYALLVRPMRRITGSIVAFRADPERAAPLDPTAVTPLAGDEIATAGRELAALQRELRAALWRNARLAALGAAMSRASHDLRGILSPALLAAERLQSHEDQRVSRAGDVLVRAVERATALVRRTVEFAREGPPALARTPMHLSAVVDEAAEQAIATVAGLRVENAVSHETMVEADAGELVRVFANLLLNAGQAGARRASVAAVANVVEVEVTIEDDGPGLPEAVRLALFRPFVTGGRPGGSGLGLAIAHDLVRAQGGELALVKSAPGGTTFRIVLPGTGRSDVAADTRADARPA